MSLEMFKTSDSLTMGVELELQLVNPHHFDLTPAAPDLLEILNRKEFPGVVTPEMTESMIEIATSIHDNYDSLLLQLQEIRDTLVQGCNTLNVGICGGGTHPFQRWFERKIFSKPRFEELSSLYGYLAKQFTVFGQHVHIGCENANQALFLLHSLNRFVPHFIALSASSPFFQGVDTLFDSARLNSVFAFPLSGRAPFILDWQCFEDDYFTKMTSTGVVRSMKDFYWDIRPKPEYGTIELRVCDTPLTVERAAALACYLQALCAYLLDGNEPMPEEDDYLVYTYNRFQACRFGLEGNMVEPKSKTQVLIKDDIAAYLIKLAPYAKKLNSSPALDELATMLEFGQNHAAELRGVYTQHQATMSLVEESVKRFLPI